MTDTTPEIVRLTADVMVLAMLDERAHVLLIRRGHDPFAGCWALPGGHVDLGEDTREAARRELAEETGLRLTDLTLTGTYAEPGRDPRGRYVTFAYVAYLEVPAAPIAGDDATAARWIPVTDALTGLRLAFDHDRIIRDALAPLKGSAMNSLNRYQMLKLTGSSELGIWDNLVSDYLNAEVPFSDGIESPVVFLSETTCQRIVNELNMLHDTNVT